MLNDWFTYNYSKCLKALERTIYDGSLPVLIRLGDDLIMLWGQQRNTVRILSARYHALKSVCHLPVALYMDLNNRCGDSLSAQDLERVSAVQRDLCEFETDEQAMSDILMATNRLIDELSDGRRLHKERLVSFEQETRSAVQACIHLAASDELYSLHAQVTDFTRDFTAKEWQALRVIICASHQPRYRQSTKQYFKCLLLENKGVEEQVLYAESFRSEPEALQLLAAQMLDRELAAFFLGSPLDLQQDVLGDAAQQVVSEIFSKRQIKSLDRAR